MTRTAAVRLLRIHKKVESGRYPDASSLAREFEVSPRTIQRDIEVLQDRFGAPLEFDHAANGYRYSREFAFPTVTLTEGEMLA